MNLGVCRGCGKSVLWIETKAGKKMPLDPAELASIDIMPGMALVSDLGEVQAMTEKNLPGESDRRRWYISHFATCSMAGSFRRAKS